MQVSAMCDVAFEHDDLPHDYGVPKKHATQSGSSEQRRERRPNFLQLHCQTLKPHTSNAVHPYCYVPPSYQDEAPLETIDSSESITLPVAASESEQSLDATLAAFSEAKETDGDRPNLIARQSSLSGDGSTSNAATGSPSELITDTQSSLNDASSVEPALTLDAHICPACNKPIQRERIPRLPMAYTTFLKVEKVSGSYAAYHWRRLSKKAKVKYEDLAEKGREEHRIKYPNYSYKANRCKMCNWKGQGKAGWNTNNWQRPPHGRGGRRVVIDDELVRL